MPRTPISTTWNETGSEGYWADDNGNRIVDDNGNAFIVFLGSGLSHVTTEWT